MLNEALRQRDELDARIETLYARVNALETLIKTNDRHGGKLILDQESTVAESTVNVAQPQVTEGVRGILTAAKGQPLTASEILGHLKQLGWEFAPQGQPLAFMYGICRRLVQQGFAIRTEKDGRLAWALKPRS